MYRVLPLPPSLNQYVYDFGTVSGDSEGEYIEKIVLNQVSRHPTDKDQLLEHPFFIITLR